MWTLTEPMGPWVENGDRTACMMFPPFMPSCKTSFGFFVINSIQDPELRFHFEIIHSFSLKSSQVLE